MQHRHIHDPAWTLAAIDSVLERGDLRDWRELFAAARRDQAVSERILQVARSHDVPGSSLMAIYLVGQLHPNLVRPAA
jgi:hypothetical protein